MPLNGVESPIEESMKRTLGLLKYALSALLCSLPATTFAATVETNAPAPLRPNIVFVLMDDQRWDDLGCTGHPFVKTPHIDRIAREGVKFNNAFTTTPLCSPSRASFFTGQYAHTHGIVDNTSRDKQSQDLVTFPRLMQQAGYETAFVGKWHMVTNDAPRPGFDYWVSVPGQGQYFNPILNINGKRKTFKNDYVTDVFTDYAVDFLKKDHEKPFVLCVSHKAVHPDLTQNADGSLSDPSASNFTPAPRHKDLYAKQPIERRPNFGAPRGKPALQREIPGLPPLSAKTGTDDEAIRNRLRMLAAADESMERILEILQDTGKLDNTLIIFTSDEGYFYGEHGLSVERRLAYEESIRIPMLMRWPKMIQPMTQINEMVLNIDIAPTLLELAGAPVPATMQGRSIMPLLHGTQNPKQPWRNSFLVEYFTDKVFPRVLNMGYQAVRTDGGIYIHYTELDNMDEMYDLRRDPYEMHNLMWEPTAQLQLMKMQLELVKLVRETNPSAEILSAPTSTKAATR